MKPIKLQEILETIGGVIVSGNPNPIIRYVITNKMYPTYWKNDTMFFHMRSKKDIYIDPGIKSMVIVTTRPEKISNKGPFITIVKVNNIRKSYWNFVRYYRNLFNIPFVSVTGTCGKTTTKEMISWILMKDKIVNKTEKSQNTSASNLKYLLNVDEHTDVTVIESAVASRGHMFLSSRYFKPQIGVLTSIGLDHLNGFPTFESYMEEKAKIFTCVGDRGKMVVNCDDENIKKINLSSYKGKIVWYGKTNSAHFKIKDIKYSTKGMNFTLAHKGKLYQLFVPGFGEHNVYNAVAAIAVAYELGVNIKESGNRLKTFKHVERHIEVLPGIKGCMLIDDTWSTNPTSIKSALEVLANISKGKRKIAVIGDIKWLAHESQKVHKSVGELVAKSGIDTLVTIGKDARLIGKRAVELGFEHNQVYMFDSPTEAQNILTKLIDKDSVVLVKTSMKQSFGPFMKRLKG